MSKVRCFENGDPNNFYYLPDITEIRHDENDKYLGYPLTKSGLIEDDCVFVPHIMSYFNFKDVCEPYDSIADGNLNKENISAFTEVKASQNILNNDWDIYKFIIDHGAYTKENGFDIQKLKELGFTLPITKFTGEVNHKDDKITKDQNDESLDLCAIIEGSIKSFYKKNAESGDNGDLIINSWMNILTVYLNALAWENEDEIGEEDLFFEDRFSNLNQILNIRTLSFFVKDKEEKMSVLDRIEQALLADTEEGKEYRKHLDSRQLWMMEYKDQKNFVLETPVISSDDKKGLCKETSKLRFIFSSDTVKVKEFFIFSDTEDTGLSMDALVDFG